jgi:hypothetical protein
MRRDACSAASSSSSSTAGIAGSFRTLRTLKRMPSQRIVLLLIHTIHLQRVRLVIPVARVGIPFQKKKNARSCALPRVITHARVA